MPTPRPPRLRTLAAAVALVAVPLACDTDPFVADEVPCRCDVEVCGPTTCAFELTLHASCAGDAERVEVVIDGHLEAETLRPGRPVVPCTRVPPGQSSELLARGGRWVWGPIVSPCNEPGAITSLVLECAAASP